MGEEQCSGRWLLPLMDCFFSLSAPAEELLLKAESLSEDSAVITQNCSADNYRRLFLELCEPKRLFTHLPVPPRRERVKGRR